LFYLSDSISELCRIASIFCSCFLDFPITAHNQHLNLKPKLFKCQLAECNALPAVAAKWLELLASRPLIMIAASQAKLPATSESPRKPAPAPSRALAGKGADKQPEQQLINIM
jgi:hypothetical protein